MKLRAPSGPRLYDAGPFTISCLSNFFCDGSHRWPKIDVIFRDRWFHRSLTCTGSKATRYRRLHIPLPYLTFATAWKFRRFGALRISTGCTKLYYRLFFISRSS